MLECFTRLRSLQEVADRNRGEVTFQEGDKVFFRIPEHLKTLKTGSTPKLLPRFCGPFKILKKVGSLAYKLELPTNSMVHLIFHVSHLRGHHYNQDEVVDLGVLVEYTKPPN